LFRAFSGDRRKGRPEDDRLTFLSMQKAQRCHPPIRGPYERRLHRSCAGPPQAGRHFDLDEKRATKTPRIADIRDAFFVDG